MFLLLPTGQEGQEGAVGVDPTGEVAGGAVAGGLGNPHLRQGGQVQL